MTIHNQHTLVLIIVFNIFINTSLPNKHSDDGKMDPE